MTAVRGWLEWRRLDDNPGRLQITSSRIVALDSGRVVDLRGLVYDGGSIPRELWTLTGLVPFGTAFDDAFAVHDKAYADSRRSDCDWTREEADDALLEVALHCGADRVLAWGVWTVTRAAGWRYWGAGLPDGEIGADLDGFEWFRE